MKTSNRQQLEKGMDKAARLISGALSGAMAEACNDYLDQALDEREYTSFTGNTVTSYTCGIYEDGKLEWTIDVARRMPKPVSGKVRKGKRKYLKSPYEGRPRSVTGKVDVDNLSGAETAEKFLASQGSGNPKGCSAIVTTGTEYSEWIERKRGLNVLSSVRRTARKTLMSRLKGRAIQ